MSASTHNETIFIDVNIDAVSLDWTRDYHQRVAELRLPPGAIKWNLIALTPKIASMPETVV